MDNNREEMDKRFYDSSLYFCIGNNRRQSVAYTATDCLLLFTVKQM